MKKISLFISITTLLFAACKKDFIEIEPISTVSVDAVYKTDKDFQDAVTATYAVFQTEYANFWQYGDVRGDDTKNGLVSNLTVSDMDKFILNNDAPILATTWTNNYNIINRANTLLSKIENADVQRCKKQSTIYRRSKVSKGTGLFQPRKNFWRCA
jgi:hypothetical protein